MNDANNAKPHIFAGNPIDRGERIRRSETEMRHVMRADEARVILLQQYNPLLLNHNHKAASIAWLSIEQAAKVVGGSQRSETFLGIDNDGAPLVAWNINHHDDKNPQLDLQFLDEPASFTDARQAATVLPRHQSGILAQAKSNLDWHDRHRFCAQCGSKTASQRGGLVRICTSSKCNAQHFPRTDPVVITLVTNGEQCLLGQSAGRLRSMRMYSALAGFMDQGETMEEAVRREVMEEAGITVGQVEYHSSQPWPFPSSLMIGSHSQALSTDIDKDDFEMTDVRWFSRQDILLALDRKHPLLNLPGEIAIAHHLIKAWATRQAGDFNQ